MWQQKRIGVVIPAFNEMARVGPTLDGLPTFVDTVIVVDDGSSDHTAAVVGSKPDARIRLVRHEKNLGVGAAIRTGYREGMALGLDVLVVMAADNQMAPSDIEPLLTAMNVSGADYAKGNRFLHANRLDMPLLRRCGSKFLSWLTRITTRYSVDDCQCGFTALDTRTAARLSLDELWPRYGYPNDLLALLRKIDARVVEVPVRPIYAGESSGLHAGHMLSISTRILWRGFELAFKASPAPERQLR
jgi:glycosyltransferase involved in cell wall biosynthesis